MADPRGSPQPTTVVVICPLEIERAAVARAIRAAGLQGHARVVRTGPGADAVRRAVEGLDAAGVRAAILAGVGGGLVEVEAAPRIGRVVDAQGRSWASRIGDGAAVVVGVDEIVEGVDGKRALRERTGADIVDTESHAFAQACEGRGLRWGVVRGVSDRWDEALPAGVGGWVDARGVTRPGRVAMGVLRRPRMIGDLVRLGRRSSGALAAMSRRVVEIVEGELAARNSAVVAAGASLAELVPPEWGAGNVLIFGGTFDPPHRAHVELPERARAAVEERTGRATWLVYVPTARSPLKSDGPVAGDERAEMVRRAVGANPRAAVWTVELDRAHRGGQGPSYTVETLRRAREELPAGVGMRLLIGADQAAEFHRWREPRGIVALAEPVVMLRGSGEGIEGMIGRMRGAGFWSEDELAAWAGRVVPVRTMDISATEVRAELMREPRDRARLVGMLGEEVLGYIEERGLYKHTNG